MFDSLKEQAHRFFGISFAPKGELCDRGEQSLTSAERTKPIKPIDLRYEIFRFLNDNYQPSWNETSILYNQSHFATICTAIIMRGQIKGKDLKVALEEAEFFVFNQVVHGLEGAARLDTGKQMIEAGFLEESISSDGLHTYELSHGFRQTFPVGLLPEKNEQ